MGYEASFETPLYRSNKEITSSSTSTSEIKDIYIYIDPLRGPLPEESLPSCGPYLRKLARRKRMQARYV